MLTSTPTPPLTTNALFTLASFRLTLMNSAISELRLCFLYLRVNIYEQFYLRNPTLKLCIINIIYVTKNIYKLFILLDIAYLVVSASHEEDLVQGDWHAVLLNHCHMWIWCTSWKMKQCRVFGFFFSGAYQGQQTSSTQSAASFRPD